MKTFINDCEMGAYSRLAKKCRQCLYKEYCQNKRLEHEAYLIPALQPTLQENIDVSVMRNYGVTAEEAQELIIKAMTGINCIIREE